MKSKQLSIILEIGVFLGGSAKVWLDSIPNVIVLALDPWSGGEWLGRFTRSLDQPEWVAEQLEADEDAMYETFLTNMWDYRDRIIPIRGMAPEALYDLHRFGAEPDLVYLDADKSGRELEVCRQLFPQAVLTGDDWFMGSDRFWQPDKGYPIRKPVRDFCRRHNSRLMVDKATWVITDESLPLSYVAATLPRYHFKSIRRRIRGAFRWCARLDKAA
ncbi:MAG: hypothetical protein IH991_02865 [Planctomycetes bacterium]|nr:hypothetical protein [Planctomycetota bacterium]